MTCSFCCWREHCCSLYLKNKVLHSLVVQFSKIKLFRCCSVSLAATLISYHFLSFLSTIFFEVFFNRLLVVNLKVVKSEALFRSFILPKNQNQLFSLCYHSFVTTFILYHALRYLASIFL
ncbi:hypothetical protein JOC58_003927 [Paenibacillus hunanensis]|uniref:Uncharacterized protein n=1 Tax=Paenibacillus hunanensis TaxID=539262 RepID=A0ABU1J3C4_9BACL|nr:hypothetical protein [Paenibacillus hunanensis]